MKTISNFIISGVIKEKILAISKVPCFIWNIDEKKILSEQKEIYGVFERNGGLVLDIKPGNRIVVDKTYLELTPLVVNEINQSEGIVVVETDYSDNFRFAFVPNT